MQDAGRKMYPVLLPPDSCPLSPGSHLSLLYFL